MLNFPFTAIRRTFVNTGSDPADSVDWTIGATTGATAAGARPGFELASSDVPGNFTVAAFATGDVVEGTLNFDGTLTDFTTDHPDGYDIALFAGIDGFNAAPGASNDWYVARAVKNRGHVEVHGQTIYVCGRRYSDDETVTTWDWILPDGSLATGQRVSWTVAPVVDSSSGIIQVKEDVTGADFYRNEVAISLSNIRPIAQIEPVLFTQESGEFTLYDAGSYDPGYLIRAAIYKTISTFYLDIDELTPGAPITDYSWAVKTNDFGEPVVIVVSGTGPTITVDLDPGFYRAELTVTDSWGAKSTQFAPYGPDGYPFQSINVPDRKISLYTHPSGAIFSAVESGVDTNIYHFDRGVGSRELRATLPGFVNPVMGGSDVGALVISGIIGPNFAGRYDTATRTSLDGGRTWN